MSGRLIILPKKRWNVWNRENVAKVRNDEKAHAEKLVDAVNGPYIIAEIIKKFTSFETIG